ncbi:hypothetical protein, partial [Nocardioides antri]|uniref:hypothetical protein n=1 Tax=Nocardioides antri TaxID=2607659 RepID=UPI00165F7492
MLQQLSVALMVIAATATPITLSSTAQAAGEPAPTALICDNTRNDPFTGTYASVTVPEGASCYLRNALVLGNVKALHGSGSVFIINTEVQRNIHIRGS